MYTVNYTNFFDFGVSSGDAQLEWYLDGSGSSDAQLERYLDGSGSSDAQLEGYLDGSGSSDAQLERYLDGSSSPIIFSTPIQFFGTAQDTLFVSQLCIFSLTGTIDDDWCFMYTLVIMNNDAKTDFCSS